jgi:hypothetical protein
VCYSKGNGVHGTNLGLGGSEFEEKSVFVEGLPRALNVNKPIRRTELSFYVNHALVTAELFCILLNEKGTLVEGPQTARLGSRNAEMQSSTEPSPVSFTWNTPNCCQLFTDNLFAIIQQAS